MKKSLGKYSFSFIVIFLLIVGIKYLMADTHQQEGVYEMVWHDEFNGTRLDTSKWSIQRRYPYKPFYNMSDNPAVFDVSKGRLRLYCKRNDGIAPNDTSRYLCGGVHTQHKMNISYGKIEIRARVVGTMGSWPALWLMREYDKGMGYGTTKYAEIDIMESTNRDKTAHQTAHNYYVDILKKEKLSYYHTVQPINYRKYNVYSVEILPNRLVFGINGKTTLTYTRNPGATGQYPYGDPMYLIVDMQYGGSSWVSKLIPSELPAYMDVDWVRVYRLK